VDGWLTRGVCRARRGSGEAGADRAAGGCRDAERRDSPGGRVPRPTVIGWRGRYEAGGIAALDDEPSSGLPAEISETDVVIATLTNGSGRRGGWGSHWSARFLARELGISFASVARIWRMC
jgi:hypothetical protein